MKITKTQKKQIGLVIGAVCVLLCVMLGQDWRQGQNSVTQGILRGRTASEIYQETYVVEQENGYKQDVNVTVYPRVLSQQEQQDMLQQAVTEFEQTYLGDNVSADQVCNDLMFAPVFCQEMVQAQYETSHPEWIWEDGSVVTDGLPTEGVVVNVRVTFLCQDALLEYSVSVRVVQPALSADEKKQRQIEEAVAQAEQETRETERFVLPKTIDGQQVQWHKKFDSETLIVLLLGAVAVIAILQKSKQDEKQRRIERERVLQREYPQMVSQLSLLMGAGMNLSVAWERMVKRYLAEQVNETDAHANRKRQYLEEMLITYREILDGSSIRLAYENFGNRVGLASYRKMMALLLQNMDKGNQDLVRLLDAEAELALEEQKNQIRRQGEEAGTKLLFPMLLLFVMVLVVIMVPALQSF